MARKSDTTDMAAGRGPTSWIAVLGEVVAILLLFAAAGAWPVPDVNETAYLTKARHGADPAWCRGDFFLETPDAHGVFYLLIGPLAATVSLERTAWVGRWLGWAALACGFRHATAPLLAGSWSRVLAAAFFSLALRHTTAAGEWVIGGCEAKVFAWALVFAACGELARSRFPRAWLALGAATALHPIVGGWGLVALLLTWCPLPWRTGDSDRPSPLGTATGSGAATVSSRGQDSPTLLEPSPTPSPPSPGFARHRYGYPTSAVGVGVLVGGGLLLAAAGVVPALGLSAGADAVTRAAAAKIHVVERLSHHLLPRTFADGMVARHVLAILLWWCLRRLQAGASPQEWGAWARIDRFIGASLVLSLAGVVVSLLEPVAPNTAYGLLRFYWFRLADALVPFGLATTVAAVLADDSAIGLLSAARPAFIRGLAATLLCLDLAHESRHWPLPGRAGLMARSDTKVDAAAWREICDWVAANTPADACFLTPRGAASFTWWTGRREVVGWKNSPQDARSLVEWRRRFVDCFSRDGGFANMERSTAALGPGRVRLAAERYGATHAIVPLDVPGVETLPFERLHANRGYAVYRLQ